MKKLNKRGASGAGILIFFLILMIIIASMFIKLNWQRFKAEASFGFTVAVLVVLVVLVLVLLIRHKIRKAKKEKAKKEEQARLEKERLERERLANGEPPLPESTLGNGKLELSDLTEAAGKIGDKLDGFLKKDTSGENGESDEQ